KQCGHAFVLGEGEEEEDEEVIGEESQAVRPVKPINLPLWIGLGCGALFLFCILITAVILVFLFVIPREKKYEGKTIKEWVALLEHPDKLKREGAKKELIFIGEPTVRPVVEALRAGMGDGEKRSTRKGREIRLMREIMSSMGEKAIPALLDIVAGHKDEKTRMIALGFLSALASRGEKTEAMMKVLKDVAKKDESEAIRDQAGHVLEHLTEGTGRRIRIPGDYVPFVPLTRETAKQVFKDYYSETLNTIERREEYRADALMKKAAKKNGFASWEEYCLHAALDLGAETWGNVVKEISEWYQEEFRRVTEKMSRESR
ncbi:MAG: hypothetical protein ACYTHN_16765, partial [Planctomycetota bacterium]